MRSGKQMNRFSEEHLLGVASLICMISGGDILLIGGGVALPKIAGYKKLRPRSEDLDFITNPTGMGRLLQTYEFVPEHTFGIPKVDGGSRVTYVNDVPVAVFESQVRGYHLPRKVFKDANIRETSGGPVYVAPIELNTALKVRRGLSRGHIYTKDALDFATMAVGAYLMGGKFDAEKWAQYMKGGVCDVCCFDGDAECVGYLAAGAKNLDRRYRPVFEQTCRDCRDAIYDFCRERY